MYWPYKFCVSELTAMEHYKAAYHIMGVDPERTMLSEIEFISKAKARCNSTKDNCQ